ncbi:MAG: patatin-like phospholipase family protein [Terracidiphilus sp.]|jgi:predicted acylesterase/phospholipase RssA
MAKKLSITIAGAVSLGSYEAGVAFEVLDALSQHNQWAEANNLPDERIEIDVLTGASAGGMTVAMLAQRLLFDGPAMSLPYSNPLYDAWVTSIDIVGLLNRKPNEDVTHSLLSSDLVQDISKTYLTGRYPKPPQPPPPPKPHPALALDGKLQLGLSLSNLTGIDYACKTKSGGQFIYTKHEDQLVRSLSHAADDRPDIWEEIRAAAVACGAFPIAFRVQDLLRKIGDFTGSPNLVQALWGGKLSRYFTYTDGGVFQNEPLGMAKNLVETQPGGHLNADQRGYLFIAPQPKTSETIPYTSDPNADSGKAFGAANANYKAVVECLAEAVIGQSEFQDWVVAERVNDKLRLLDEQAGELQALFLSRTLTAAATTPVSAALLPQLFQGDDAMARIELNAARTQLKQQYSLEYSKFGADHVTADAWLDAVLVLEVAAGLHEKEEMFIYDFVAETAQLASNGLHAFVGFFDVRYRKHDYDYGRSMGQQRLAFYKNQPGSVLANLHWTPKAIDPIDPNLNNLDMSKVDKNKRNQVCSQMCDAANSLLQELGKGVIVRKAIMTFFIKGQIKEMLAL